MGYSYGMRLAHCKPRCARAPSTHITHDDLVCMDAPPVRRIQGDSHIELPCNEVLGEEKERAAKKLSDAARAWWQSLLKDQHSFSKPAFQLGLNGWSVTNILPDGAHERTPGRVELLPNGAAGFSTVGDSMCFSINVSCAVMPTDQLRGLSFIHMNSRHKWP